MYCTSPIYILSTKVISNRSQSKYQDHHHYYFLEIGKSRFIIPTCIGFYLSYYQKFKSGQQKSVPIKASFSPIELSECQGHRAIRFLIQTTRNWLIWYNLLNFKSTYTLPHSTLFANHLTYFEAYFPGRSLTWKSKYVIPECDTYIII